MKITDEELENVALLSRLTIVKEKKEAYQQDLTNFLNYIDNLKELSTENIMPTTYALPMQNVFREDVIKPSLKREDALLNAPLKEDGYFKVPKILEE